MKLGAQGLTGIKTEDLREVLRAVHRGDLPCPITQIGLGQAGLLRLVDDLAHVRGLDEQAVRAVLVAALAERR
jgi:hypothetical protein